MIFLLNDANVEYIDQIVRRWGRVVVPFFRPGKSKTAAHVFGSGFLAYALGRHWLVTALHVIEDVLSLDACVINVAGHGIVLERVPFFPDRENDLAFAPIDRLLSTHDIKAIPVIDLEREESEASPLGYHPATKNELDPRWGKIDRQLLSLTAELAPTGTLVPTEIRNPVLFAYEPKVQVDSLLNRIGPPPALQGMSGGPTLELRATRLSEEEFRFHPRLSGVLVEWRRKERIIVATSATRLREALSERARRITEADAG